MFEIEQLSEIYSLTSELVRYLSRTRVHYASRDASWCESGCESMRVGVNWCKSMKIGAFKKRVSGKQCELTEVKT